MMNNALLIFVKNLIYGQVKTRLAATVGNDKALKIYKELLQHTNNICKNINAHKIVFYSDFIEEDIWQNKEFKKEIQQGKDLGERMKNAFKKSFESGFEKVMIVGTDCPQINETILENAFAELDQFDIVLGPANDGGYYLLGMKKLCPLLFQNIKWSTGMVLEKTLTICNQNKLTYFLLPQLIDIDEEEDLKQTKFLQE
jgi:rSAM/selenodomain-associated transferase 1